MSFGSEDEAISEHANRFPWSDNKLEMKSSHQCVSVHRTRIELARSKTSSTHTKGMPGPQHQLLAQYLTPFIEHSLLMQTQPVTVLCKSQCQALLPDQETSLIHLKDQLKLKAQLQTPRLHCSALAEHCSAFSSQNQEGKLLPEFVPTAAPGSCSNVNKLDKYLYYSFSAH